MPVTFLAHQAPVLPLVRRWPGRWDGVALVAGSLAPDLAYVTRGWGYGPWSIPLWFDGHRPQNVLVVTAVAALLGAVVRRVVLPVLPLAMPDAGRFHLHDLWFVSRRRPRWWITVASAFLGVLTHLVLDAFTHEDSSVVLRAGWLQARWFTVGSHTLHTYSALQYGGSVVLGAYTVGWLWRAGSTRSFRPAGAGPPDGLGRGALVRFWSIVAIGIVVAVGYADTRWAYLRHEDTYLPANRSVVIIAFCWVSFFGLLLASLAASATGTMTAELSDPPASVDA